MNESARLAPRSRTGRALVLLASAIAMIAVAVLCAFFLQFSTHPFWADRAPTEIFFSPLDATVIMVVIAGAWAVLGRLTWSLSLVAGSALLMAAINYTKIALRREPLYPADRSFAGDLGSLITMVDLQTVCGIIAAVAGVVAVIAAIGWFVGCWVPPPQLRHAHGGLNRRLIGARAVTLVLSAVLLVHATHFNRPGNLWRTLYDINAYWQPWSQVHNYRSNGFVGGFLSNMPVGVMKQPIGYGAEAMARIAEDYTERAARINASREGSLADANVVFVLSESFTDPSWVEGFTLEENPVPEVQRVMAETIAGKMYALSYGGGTSTMEFETLTGQSVGLFNPQVTAPYPMYVGNQTTYPSTVGAFAEDGHRTVAIHSYNLDMYKRKQVYKAFGFDEVIDDAAMHDQGRIDTSRYISDGAAFNEVLYQLDRHEGPEFVSLLTMQNHGPHGDSYVDPIGADIVVSKNPVDYPQYARGLAFSDAALGNFLTQLQARDEKTIVVFYGDHHPGIYTDELIQLNQPDGTFTTPFFVWNSTNNQTQAVPAVGPAMFLPLVYEAADAPVSPYIALLDEVRRTVPVIQPARVLDAQGLPVDLEDLDAPTAALIDDLRMVQYDFSAGERFVVDTMWPGAVVQKAN